MLLCLILCDPVDYSLPGSSAHGISQARILKWVVAISSSRGSSQPRDRCWSGVPLPFLPRQHCAAAAAKSLQSCLTLCDPMDCSPPGSSIHGIFQARVLAWGAIAFSTKTAQFGANGKKKSNSWLFWNPYELWVRL